MDRATRLLHPVSMPSPRLLFLLAAVPLALDEHGSRSRRMVRAKVEVLARVG